MLAESLVPRYRWAKYFKVWVCSAWVGTGEQSEGLDLNLLLFVVVQFRRRFVTALLKENDSLPWKNLVDLSSFVYAQVKADGCSFLGHSEGDMPTT